MSLARGGPRLLPSRIALLSRKAAHDVMRSGVLFTATSPNRSHLALRALAPATLLSSIPRHPLREDRLGLPRCSTFQPPDLLSPRTRRQMSLATRLPRCRRFRAIQALRSNDSMMLAPRLARQRKPRARPALPETTSQLPHCSRPSHNPPTGPLRRPALFLSLLLPDRRPLLRVRYLRHPLALFLGSNQSRICLGTIPLGLGQREIVVTVEKSRRPRRQSQPMVSCDRR